MKNVKCLKCGKVFDKYGIGPHMRHVHNGLRAGKHEEGTNWEWTDEKRTNLPKRKYTKRDDTKGYKCLHCGKVTKTHNGMWYHLRNKHDEKTKRGENYEIVGGEKIVQSKQKKKIIAPNLQYVEVPAIIRIPVHLGQVQIVSIDGS